MLAQGGMGSGVLRMILPSMILPLLPDRLGTLTSHADKHVGLNFLIAGQKD